MTEDEIAPWIDLACAIVRQAQRDAKKGDTAFVQENYGFLGAWASSPKSPPTKMANRQKIAGRILA